MNTIYKYCDGRGVEILRNLVLKVTPPNQFNDPFEFTPHIVCSNVRRTAKRLVKEKDAIRELYWDSVRDGQFKGNFRQFRKMHRQYRPDLVKLAETAIPATLAALQARLLDQISTAFGVLCMSKKRNSLLMWGHYCDKHRGIVIGFDDSNPIFKEGPGLRPVKYVRARVQIDERARDQSVEWFKSKDDLIFAKNDEWAYEQELRQLFLLSSLTKRPLDDGTPGYFRPISPLAVLSVTLGARCSPELANKVRLILQSQHFSNVRLDRAFLHESDFALRFE